MLNHGNNISFLAAGAAMAMAMGYRTQARRAPPGLSGLVACFAFFAAMPVTAETLAIEGLYPARNREAAQVGSLVVERSGGQDGSELAVEGMSAEFALYGQHYFRVFAERSSAFADAGIGRITARRVAEADYAAREARLTGDQP